MRVCVAVLILGYPNLYLRKSVPNHSSIAIDSLYIAVYHFDRARAVAGAANDAVQNVGTGSGAAYGTAVHSEFADLVDGMGNSSLSTEISYKNGVQVPYGTAGSIRADVVEGPLHAPTAVYDLKTGSATLTPARIQQIQSHLPGGSNVPVQEIKPQ